MAEIKTYVWSIINSTKILLLSILCLAISESDCFGAEISVEDLGVGSLKIIAISGPIEVGDDMKFRRIASSTDKAIVLLSSPGGLVEVGLSIGSQIRIHQFATWVSREKFCASACALIWLGGNHRYVNNGSKIGFHAAYVENGSFKKESGMANALVGAYLNQIGIPIKAIKYITSPAPDQIQWLTAEDAKALGIEVRNLDQLAEIPPKNPTNPKIVQDPVAQRALRLFKKRYKEAGLLGLNSSILDCYRRAAKLTKEESAKYCVILDSIASIWDIANASMQGVPSNEFNNVKLVYVRAKRALSIFGYKDSEITSRTDEWSKLGVQLLSENN